MAKVLIPNPIGSDPPGEPLVIDLKQPWIAGLLAWAVPGLGHLYQGRTGKGLLFMICILGTFAYGMYLGGGKVVYAAVPWEEQYRWQYFCQLGTGLVSTPMLVQRERVLNDQEPLWNGFMAPPRNQPTPWQDDSAHMSTQPNELAMWTVKYHPFFEIGTVYTIIAGLLNILVIGDAVAGPLVLPHKSREQPARPAADQQQAGSKSSGEAQP